MTSMTSTTDAGKAPGKTSRLGNVIRGRQKQPTSFCFYGPESVGKTTLAAHSPNPIFIDIEKGSAQLDVARYPFENGVAPLTYAELLGAVDDLLNNEHDFKTLVIDSIDRMEQLIWAHLVEKFSGNKSGINEKARKIETIAGFPWGRGYVVAVDELIGLLKKLERLKEEKGMSIIFVGHSCVIPFSDPTGEDYDRYALRLHVGNKQGGNFAGQVKEWVDVLGFCCFDEGGGSGLDGGKSKGWSSGERLLKLQRDAAFDAKSRIPMPKEIALDIGNPWQPLQDALDVGQDMKYSDVLNLIKAELERIGDKELANRVRAACKATGKDAAKLARHLMALKNKESKKTENDNE